jgi:hypothetical protein
MREFEDSLNVHCPVCGAEPSKRCEMISEFPRFESHIERGWLAAIGHLTPRLLWASESGEVPYFVRAIAEAASIAGAAQFASAPGAVGTKKTQTSGTRPPGGVNNNTF